MATRNKVKVCWLGKRHKKKYVCFIPFTIDGMGTTIPQALQNLEKETIKIIEVLQKSKSKIRCSITVPMVRRAIYKHSWWKHEKSQSGKAG